MKILMLCDFYNESLEFQENILTKYYTKYNHEVTVVTSTFENVFDYYTDNHDNSNPIKIYFDGKAKIIKLPYRYNILNKLRAYISIEEILKKEKPDLIYVHDVMLNILEAVNYIKKNPDVKMIMDYHADYSNSGKNWLSLTVLHGIIRKWYLDKSMKYLAKIFPIVPAGEVFLHEIYKVPYEKMEVLPLGADVDLCNDVLNEKDKLTSLKNTYGIKDHERVIITGGKLSPRKKTEILIEVFNNMECNNVHLIIIGESSKKDVLYMNMLKEQSKGHSKIHFTGWLSTADVYAHYHISDLAVFPASQSILWQQAIAAGLPLIVGNTGHQSVAYLNLYQNIIMLDKNDITSDEIKKHIEMILMDIKLYDLMRLGAKKVTEELLDWNHLINRTMSFNTMGANSNEN